MQLENQVISLNLAKRLKELEVKQESLWWWQDAHGFTSLLSNLQYEEFPHKHNWVGDEFYSAFTVAELGEMLPKNFYFSSDPIQKSIRIIKSMLASNQHHEGIGFIEDTEANARAKMLVYLLEKGLIK